MVFILPPGSSRLAQKPRLTRLLLSFVVPLEQVLEVLNTELTSLIALAVAFGGAVNLIVGLQVGPLAKSIESLKADTARSTGDIKTGLAVFASLSIAIFVAMLLEPRP